MNRKNYDLVDVSKFVLAILVVAIHAGVPIAGWAGRLAVPYFFIISGYFYFKKFNGLSDRREKIESYLIYSKRIFYLLLIWLILYMPLVVYRIYVTGDFSVTRIGISFLIGRLPGFGFSWYLCASVFGLGTLLLMMRYLGTKITLFVAVFFEVLCILLSSYHVLLLQWKNLFDFSSLNSLVFVFSRSWIYFILGNWLSKNLNKIKLNVNPFVLPGLAIVLLEHFLINSYGFCLGGPGTDESFFIPLVAFCFAVAVLKSDVKIKNAALMREMSTFIYMAHGGALVLQKSISHICSFTMNNLTAWICATLIVFLAYYLMSRNEKVIKMFA